ncbi:hypothetical protein CRUP_003141, partial [Coryphaenoides rupestris]
MNRRPLPGSSSSPSSSVQWLNRRGMGVRTGGDGAVSLCQKALQIVTELCFSGHVDREKCANIFPLESTSPDFSISLLAVVVGFCGLALLVVSLFVFWKLCWPIWRSKALCAHTDSSGRHLGLRVSLPDAPALTPTPTPPHPPPPPPPAPPDAKEEEKKVKEKRDVKVKLQEAAMKISQTSPDIPAELHTALRGKLSQQAKIQRQTTEPTSSSRHNSFRRHLPRQMNVTSMDFSMEALPVRQSSAVSIGRIKPELYKQKSVDSQDGEPREPLEPCGKLSFSLRYDHEEQCLVVRILKALDLPAKDFTGTSDPYVKMYLLPDRKKKFQTRVHRKNLNPMFDETFRFAAPYDELCARKLHFSVTSTPATTESVDLGEIMFSLCYLPTAGRMTLTVIKCRNLKAMDITGSSDPYVKVSLICDGRRLKKRKTTTKKCTLNPVYNEAIIFDIPPENVEQGLGRDHWNEMLAYPRKPITHWHALGE